MVGWRLTSIVEHQLAYDVIHTLNRFFKQMGDPNLANGGIIDNYLGDGLLALFRVEGGDSVRDPMLVGQTVQMECWAASFLFLGKRPNHPV
jgi:class 3 adenylate cyclase